MRLAQAHRRHTVRVAAIATLVVMLAYVVAAIVVNLVVTNHLLRDADARLVDSIQDARQQPQPAAAHRPGGDDRDLDDAPAFLWSIGPLGRASALTPGAPALPVQTWNGVPVSLQVGSSTFRFDSSQVDGTTLVAGESIANVTNVQTTLLVAEVVFGAILALAVFGGALVVGLRAAAPSELVRRRQAEFTADASHELRTPISVIEAEVDLALDRPRDQKAYRDVLERVGHEGKRLRHIVEDLLWLARADDDGVEPGASAVADVADVVAACVDRFGAVAATNDIELRMTRVGQGPFTVQASAELIDRLAGVLIDNACKFAGAPGRVEATVRSVGARVVLRVDDTGPGIPADQRDAVFDRFHRANDSVVGAGLGLAIADAVLRSTHGQWNIGVADLGGARMEATWRRVVPRRTRSGQAADTSLSESRA